MIFDFRVFSLLFGVNCLLSLTTFEHRTKQWHYLLGLTGFVASAVRLLDIGMCVSVGLHRGFLNLQVCFNLTRAATHDEDRSIFFFHLVCKMSENGQNTHHNFQELKVTSLNDPFCPTNSPKPLNIHSTFINIKEARQYSHLRSWKQTILAFPLKKILKRIHCLSKKLSDDRLIDQSTNHSSSKSVQLNADVDCYY